MVACRTRRTVSFCRKKRREEHPNIVDTHFQVSLSVHPLFRLLMRDVFQRATWLCVWRPD